MDGSADLAGCKESLTPTIVIVTFLLLGKPFSLWLSPFTLV